MSNLTDSFEASELRFIIPAPVDREDLTRRIEGISDFLGEPTHPEGGGVSIVIGAQLSSWERGIQVQGDTQSWTWSADSPTAAFTSMMEDGRRERGGSVDLELDPWVQSIEAEIIDDTRLPYALLALEVSVSADPFEERDNPAHEVYSYFQAIRAWVEDILHPEGRHGLPTVPGVIYAHFEAGEDTIQALNGACREYAQQAVDFSNRTEVDNLSERSERMREMLPGLIRFRQNSSLSHIVGYANLQTVIGSIEFAQGTGLHTIFMATLGEGRSVNPDIGGMPILGIKTTPAGPFSDPRALASLLAGRHWLESYVGEVPALQEDLRACLSLLDSDRTEDLEEMLGEDLLPIGVEGAALGVEFRALKRIFLPQVKRLGEGRWGPNYDVGVFPALGSYRFGELQEPSYLRRLSESTADLFEDVEHHLEQLKDDHDRLSQDLHTLVQHESRKASDRTNTLVLWFTAAVVLLGVADLIVQFT